LAYAEPLYRTFSALFPSLLTSAAFHHDVVSFYDVPSLSIRDIILPRIMTEPDIQIPKWFRTGRDVQLDDGKVREWGGIPVDLMHVSCTWAVLASEPTVKSLRYLRSATRLSVGW